MDELFELQYLQQKKITTVFDNKAFYGDHTSFPGEYLLYYLPLRFMGLMDKPAVITTDPPSVSGIDKNGFLRLASVKIDLFVISFWLLYLICKNMTGWGSILALMMYGFNYQLVYHAFEIRPYSVLPVLAIVNLFLAMRQWKWWGDAVHAFVIFFTCIYHAYGVLIAFLPLFFIPMERHPRALFMIPFALLAWIYYASYNTFGMIPNVVQSQVDPFQFMPKQFFMENLIKQLSGGSLIFYAVVPLLVWSFIKGLNREEWKFFILLIAFPLLAIFAVDIKTHYWIHPRQYVWVIPFFAVFCGKMVDRIVKDQKIN